MSVYAESRHIGLTWEAFIERPEDLLRHAELHDGEIMAPRRKDLLRKPTHHFSDDVQELWLVDCDERVLHVLQPSGECHEWVDGDVAVSPSLTGFEVSVADVISQVS